MTTLAMPAPQKLPIWRTAGACYAIVAQNLGQLVRISWLWLLIMLPFYAVLHSLLWSWTGRTVDAVLVAGIAELPFMASIAVAWHRLILQQERVTAPAYLRLDGFVWRYVLYSLLFLLVTFAPLAFPFAFDLPDSLVLADIALMAAIGFLVVPRASLVLPAVALGERLSLLQAWQITHGNTLRLALVTLLCLLPTGLSAFALARWVEARVGESDRIAYVVHELIISLENGVFIIFAVTLLSLSYRFFAAPRAATSSPLA